MDLIYEISETNILAFLANLIGILCNVPLIINTIRKGKADDISLSFLLLRILASILWVIYSIQIELYVLTLSNVPGILSSSIVLVYKIKGIYKINNYKYNDLEKDKESMSSGTI
jgi:uncharacterized protein with PQ loop repeat